MSLSMEQEWREDELVTLSSALTWNDRIMKDCISSWYV